MQLFVEDEKGPNIQFDVGKIEQGIPNLHQDTLIASFSAKTKDIKSMHVAIQEDVALKFNLRASYRKFIFGSSRSDEVQNCLTWCLDKMKTHLKIDVPMRGIDFIPSFVVAKLIKSQAATPDEPEKSYKST